MRPPAEGEPEGGSEHPAPNPGSARVDLIKRSANADNEPPECPVEQPPAVGPVQPAHGRGGFLAEILIALAIAVLLAGLGLGLGVVWSEISPKVELEMTSGGPAFTESEPEGYIASEATYTFMAIATGFVTAVAVWLLVRRRRGPIILAGLAIGSVAGAVLMAWLGHRIGAKEYTHLLTSAPVGERFERPVEVRSHGTGFFGRFQGTSLIQAVVAVATYTLAAGFATFANLLPVRYQPPMTNPFGPYPQPGPYPPPPTSYPLSDEFPPGMRYPPNGQYPPGAPYPPGAQYPPNAQHPVADQHSAAGQAFNSGPPAQQDHAAVPEPPATG